jgi:hypothetical protein
MDALENSILLDKTQRRSRLAFSEGLAARRLAPQVSAFASLPLFAANDGALFCFLEFQRGTA